MRKVAALLVVIAALAACGEQPEPTPGRLDVQLGACALPELSAVSGAARVPERWQVIVLDAEQRPSWEDARARGDCPDELERGASCALVLQLPPTLLEPEHELGAVVGIRGAAAHATHSTPCRAAPLTP